jgi:transposase
MRPVELHNDQWSKILKFLRSCPDVYVGNKAQCRRFSEAVLWMARSGAQWRLLPAADGNWNTLYKRFARWCEKGIWERMHHHFADAPDMEHLSIDSTLIRAHPCAAGAPKKGAASKPRPWAAAGVDSAPKSTSAWRHWATPCALSLAAGSATTSPRGRH